MPAFNSVFAISSFQFDMLMPSDWRSLHSSISFSTENAIDEYYEREHVCTSAWRYVALHEAAVHVAEYSVEVCAAVILRRTMCCFAPPAEHAARFFLHLLHHGKRRAVDDVGVVEVAHYAQKREVERVRFAVLAEVRIER